MKDEARIRRVCMFILMLGLFFKLIYAIRVPYDISPHDLGHLPDENGEAYGHLGYIYYLYKHKHLFAGIRRQFYHPPLFHILAACVFDISVLFGADDETAYECVQMANTFVAAGCSAVMYGIYTRLPIKEKLLIPATILASFFPAFYFMGTEINNDCLATFFSLLCIYAAFSWADRPDVKRFFVLCVLMVLSVWTKWSGVLLLPVVLCIFLIVSWEKRIRLKTVFCQMLAMGFVVLPLCMAWMMYLIICYRVPFFYIPTLSVDSRQYIGDLDVKSRISPAVFSLSDSLVTDLSDGAAHGNIWKQTALTAAFDEGILNEPDQIMGIVLLWGILVFGVICLVAVFWLVGDYATGFLYRVVFPIGFLLTMMAYVIYCFKNTYISAINFRYIPCALLYETAAAWIVLSKRGVFSGILRALMLLCTALIAIDSTLLYLLYT